MAQPQPQFTTDCNDPSCRANQHQVIAVTTVLIFSSTAAFILRMVARHFVRSAFAIDDHLALLALITSLGCNAVMLGGFVHGFGMHDAQVGPFNVREQLRGTLALEILWITANTATKFSLLYFYCRLFPTKKLRIGCYVTAVVVGCVYIAAALVLIFQCMPANFYWNRALATFDPSIKGACHVDSVAFYAATSTINMLTDIVVFLLPVPVIWYLKISLSKKIGVTFAFTISIFVCAVSIVRLTRLDSLNPVDVSAGQIGNGLWSCAEASGGTIAACVPTFTPIVLRLLGQRVAPERSKYRYNFGSRDGAISQAGSKMGQLSGDSMVDGAEEVKPTDGGRNGSFRDGLKRHVTSRTASRREDDEYPLHGFTSGGITVTSEMQQTTESVADSNRLAFGAPTFEVSASKVPIVWRGITAGSDWR